LLIKIKIKSETKTEKSLPKLPSEDRNSVGKLIGTNPSISNLMK